MNKDRETAKKYLQQALEGDLMAMRKGLSMPKSGARTMATNCSLYLMISSIIIMLYFNLLLLFVDTKVRFLIENTSCHSSFFVICNIFGE